MREQLARGEEVVPVGPAAFAESAVRFCRRLLGNRLRRDEALALPFGETFAEQFEHLSLAGEVTFVRRGVAADLFGFPVLAITVFTQRMQ